MRRVARLAAVGPGDRVVEIGAGLGSLTLALVETGAEVTAVETDQRLVEVLGEVVAGHPVRVIHADALELDWDRLLEPGRGWHLVANLPYNVAIPLVLDLLRDVPAFPANAGHGPASGGERLAAEPGDRSYGWPSVKGDVARVSVVGSVPKTVFHPAPNVESVLVNLNAARSRRSTSPPRRCSASWKRVRRPPQDAAPPLGLGTEALAAGVRPQARAEELGIELGPAAAAAS